MAKQHRTREEKLEILNKYKNGLMTAQFIENEILKNEIRDLREEIEILTGDLRATADALDDL